MSDINNDQNCANAANNANVKTENSAKINTEDDVATIIDTKAATSKSNEFSQITTIFMPEKNIKITKTPCNFVLYTATPTVTAEVVVKKESVPTETPQNIARIEEASVTASSSSTSNTNVNGNSIANGDGTVKTETELGDDDATPEYGTTENRMPPEADRVHSPEPAANNETNNAEKEVEIPENFFDDLLVINGRQNQNDLKEEPKTENVENQEVGEVGEVPPNFFDELLIDDVAQRLEKAQEDELEQKYALRIKELHELAQLEKEQSQKKNKKRKKHKHRRRSSSDGEHNANDEDSHKHRHSSKKRHKRSRDRYSNSSDDSSMEHNNSSEKRKRYVEDLELPNHYRPPPVSTAPLPTCSLRRPWQLKNEPLDNTVDGLKVRESYTLKRLEPINDNKQATKEPPRTLNAKRNWATANAIAARALLDVNLRKMHESDVSEFVLTHTISVLPKSEHFIFQQGFENRSPLTNNCNVTFKTFGAATNLKLKNWGLREESAPITKILRKFNFDIDELNAKLNDSNMTIIVRKLQKQSEAGNAATNGEQLIERNSVLYANAATQTLPMCPSYILKEKCAGVLDMTKMTNYQRYAMLACKEILLMPRHTPEAETVLLDAIRKAHENLEK